MRSPGAAELARSLTATKGCENYKMLFILLIITTPAGMITQ
jgi:hypothetical protein